MTIDQFRARFPHASADTIRKNFPDGVVAPSSTGAEAAPKERRLRQAAIKLNGLETAYQDVLHAKYGPADVVAQSIRVRLGSGAWFKADFFVKSELLFVECKGPHAFRGGFEFLKIAASIHTWAKFQLVWKNNGEWMWQDILP